MARIVARIRRPCGLRPVPCAVEAANKFFNCFNFFCAPFLHVSGPFFLYCIIGQLTFCCPFVLVPIPALCPSGGTARVQVLEVGAGRSAPHGGGDGGPLSLRRRGMDRFVREGVQMFLSGNKGRGAERRLGAPQRGGPRPPPSHPSPSSKAPLHGCFH